VVGLHHHQWSTARPSKNSKSNASTVVSVRTPLTQQIGLGAEAADESATRKSM
jgi:hypothetical protein